MSVAPPRVAAVFALALALTSAGCLQKSAEHRLRANAFLRGNDAASALKECDEGLADKKDDLALLILRGKALFELDRLDDARGSYAEAVRVGAKDELAEAHLGLAMIASRKHEWPTARAEFADLVEASPGDATSQLNLAKACLELKDIPCAVEHGEAAHKAREKDETILFALGTIYLAASRVDDAEHAFEGITALTPGAASAPYGLALVAAKRGDKDKAIAELDEAVKRKLPNPDRIAKDPGLAPLKDDPRFVALTAKAASAK